MMFFSYLLKLIMLMKKTLKVVMIQALLVRTRLIQALLYTGLYSCRCLSLDANSYLLAMHSSFRCRFVQSCCCHLLSFHPPGEHLPLNLFPDPPCFQVPLTWAHIHQFAHEFYSPAPIHDPKGDLYSHPVSHSLK